MNRRAIQLFFLLLIFYSAVLHAGELSTGQTYNIKFNGLNGEALSTSDGHITIVVVVKRTTWLKAQTLGDRVPDEYIGDAVHRMITIVKFGKHSAPVRRVLTAGAKRRLNLEAKRAQPRYTARKLARNPREDIFAVVDFESAIASQFGVQPDADFHAFLFGRNGELQARWNDVPTSEELAAALK